MTITHPDKVLFPDDGITKGELAAYYDAVAPFMLPHLRRRPITMERFPSGISAKGFLQKNVVKGFPPWLKRVETREEGRHGALPPGRRSPVAAVAGQPEHRHAPRLGVAGAAPRSARPVHLRPRSVAGRPRGAANRDARPARPARRGRRRQRRQDVGVQGIPRRGAVAVAARRSTRAHDSRTRWPPRWSPAIRSWRRKRSPRPIAVTGSSSTPDEIAPAPPSLPPTRCAPGRGPRSRRRAPGTK